MSHPAPAVPGKRLHVHLCFPQAARAPWLAPWPHAARQRPRCNNRCSLPGILHPPLQVVRSRVSWVTAFPVPLFGPRGYYLTDQKVCNQPWSTLKRTRGGSGSPLYAEACVLLTCCFRDLTRAHA